MTDQDPFEVARAVVLQQLTTQPRTRRQLADALGRKRIPDDVAAEILDRFEELELIDDEAFAHAWVESRHRGRGLSRRALAHELRHRGVADDTVREAVDEISAEDELEAARRIVRSRLASTARDDAQRRIRRLVGVLARKGYGPGVAIRAIKEELRDEVGPEAVDLIDAEVDQLEP
jgi:regulatory protein